MLKDRYGLLSMKFICATFIGAALLAGLLHAQYVSSILGRASAITGVRVTQGSDNLLHGTLPIYPARAREKHIEGTVQLQLTIDDYGEVSDAQVINGPQELRAAALRSVLTWHYAAASAPSTLVATLDFRLPTTSEALAAQSSLKDRRFGPSVTGPPLPADFHGTVRAIEAPDLSREARAALVSQLPVHEGDVIDNAAVERVREAARQFDNHLVAAAIPVENSGDVFLLLFAPGPDEGVPFGGEVAVHSLNASAGAHVGSARRIRLGENVLAAKLLEHPEPEYPALARQARLQGRVVMRAIIGEDGRVENLQLLSGHPMLVASAMEAVRQWVYQPTLLNGKPVEVEGEVHVDFTLPSSTP